MKSKNTPWILIISLTVLSFYVIKNHFELDKKINTEKESNIEFSEQFLQDESKVRHTGNIDSSLGSPNEKQNEKEENSVNGAEISQIFDQNQTKDNYKKAVLEIGKEIERLQLDPKELDHLAANYGPNEFLKHIPNTLAQKFKSLQTIILSWQEEQLMKDGKDINTFIKKPVHIPTWIIDESQKYSQYSVTAEVQRHINEVAQKSEVTNEDIINLADLCQNPNCLTKGIQNWIKNNHLISNEQFDLIKRYL